jgi:hypothetical protein
MLAYVAGYSVLGVAGYPWYSLPVHLVFTVLFGVGLGALAELVPKIVATPKTGTAAAIVLVAVTVLPLASSTVNKAVTSKTPARHAAYLELAKWLRENTDRSDSVAYHEIGHLGYYTDNRVIDLVGLVTPEITPNVAVGDFGSGFWQYLPDYLVHLEGSRFFTGIVGYPRFPEQYRPVARLSGYDDLRLTVYRRVDDP